MSETPDPTHICWLDFETTGLGDVAKPLEIACVMTDMELNEVDRVHHVFKQNGPWLDLMNDYVFNMHMESGLITDVRAATSGLNETYNIDFALYGWAKSISPDLQIAVGGSGVAHFDRALIEKFLPQFDLCLTYWSIDIGVLRRVMTRLAGFEFERAPIAHRAMADVDQSIDEAKRLLTVIKKAKD